MGPFRPNDRYPKPSSESWLQGPAEAQGTCVHGLRTCFLFAAPYCCLRRSARGKVDIACSWAVL